MFLQRMGSKPSSLRPDTRNHPAMNCVLGKLEIVRAPCPELRWSATLRSWICGGGLKIPGCWVLFQYTGHDHGERFRWAFSGTKGAAPQRRAKLRQLDGWGDLVDPRCIATYRVHRSGAISKCRMKLSEYGATMREKPFPL
jgi:hypothetical protein